MRCAKSIRHIGAAIGAATVNTRLLTLAEHLQYEGYRRREETNDAILGLAKYGGEIKEIIRRIQYGRSLVRNVLRGQHLDIFRVWESSLGICLQCLHKQWDASHHNSSELWRRLRQHGFSGSHCVVSEWATHQRKAEKTNGSNLS